MTKNVYLNTTSEGRFSNNFFDMLPGKSYIISFSGEMPGEVGLWSVSDSY